MEIITISKEFRFEASHILPQHPGKCSRLHGHSWVLRVEVSGPINPLTGFVIDYTDLKDLVQLGIIDIVDHQHLGCGGVILGAEEDYQSAVFGAKFYPSSENLVLKFRDILDEVIDSPSAQLTAIILEETCTSRAEWRRSYNA